MGTPSNPKLSLVIYHKRRQMSIYIIYKLLNLLTMSGKPSIIPEYIIINTIRVKNITINKLLKL